MPKMFVVYDSKAEAYNSPFFLKSRGEALRGWSDTVNDPQTMFYKHPSDFTLFEMGEFDENTGEIRIYEAKASLGTALEFKKSAESGSKFGSVENLARQ